MDKIEKLKVFCQGEHIFFVEGAALAGYTTFAIGGPCPLLVEPATEVQITGLMATLKALDLPFYLLGRGSNLLFPDEGFAGVVVHLSKRFDRITQEEAGMVTAQAGVLLMDLAEFAAEKSLAGLAFSYGIPGSVGGAVYMNAGAYGGEMKDVVLACRYLGQDGLIREISGDELDFSYRHSFLTDTGGVLLSTRFGLSPGDPGQIRQEMDNHYRARWSKQPMELPSAGSVFKRPVGGYASQLIDGCHLKGRAVGGAQVSEKHAGFIVSQNKATCADVLALIEEVRREVLGQTGFVLECELKVATPRGWH